MGKRRRFSRWRRLPGVYRIGEDKPDDPLSEPERLTLYVPAGALDQAEAQARRLGYRDGQEYCTELVLKAIEAEHSREQIAGVESKRGPLEGFHEISEDAAYLVELSAAVGARHASNPPPTPSADHPQTVVPIDVAFPTGPPEVAFLDHADPLPPAGIAVRSSVRPDSLPEVMPVPPPHSAGVILRHTGQFGDDATAFLPCLRRGESVPPGDVAELAQALSDLERDFRGVRALDRGLAFALHRLAFESQILATDAWPGAFDVWTIDMVRAVQEAVERILSDRDIRYYAPSHDPTAGPSLPPPETPR